MSDAAMVGMLVGLAVGVIPIVVGALKSRPGLGIAGFIVCGIVGFYFGLLGAAPVCGLCIWSIVKDSSTRKS